VSRRSGGDRLLGSDDLPESFAPDVSVRAGRVFARRRGSDRTRRYADCLRGRRERLSCRPGTARPRPARRKRHHPGLGALATAARPGHHRHHLRARPGDGTHRGVAIFAAFRDRLERYRRYRGALFPGIEAASQAEVDRARAELRFSTDRSAAPKGPAPGTHDEIARTVRDRAEGVTADEVAKAVGVSRVTAWRDLERLTDEGTVLRQTEYGKTGRPSTRYQWR